MENDREAYIKLLSKTFKNENEVLEEMINLKSILQLPKGTEVFLSDIHGEYEPFTHVLNSGAGRVRNKIELAFGDKLSVIEKNKLATLIYYPEEKIKREKEKNKNIVEWYEDNIVKLVEVCRRAGGKYTRSKVRKAFPKFKYILDELVHVPEEVDNKDEYYNSIIKAIVELGIADEFIISITDAIKSMSIDHLHIVGDIFDRGIHPDYIIEELMKFHSVDIQWGNHDILWMGAAMRKYSMYCKCYQNMRKIWQYKNFGRYIWNKYETTFYICIRYI